MKTVLICPSERPAVELLSRTVPLVTVPLLGQSLLEYWLSSMASSGVTEVMILASDRTEEVQALAADGSRWGISVSVVQESRELTPAQALLKYTAELDPVAAQSSILTMDHFPGLEQFPLFGSYAELFAGLCQWLPQALMPDRVGYREVRTGVWVSTYASVSPGATLQAPCWIGRHASIAAGALIGPGTIIEDGVLIERGAEIAHSRIASGTFVGALARMSDSIAMGSTLVNWRTGSIVEIPDPFLLCALFGPRRQARSGWFARLTGMVARGKEEASVSWKHLVLNKEG